MADTDFLKGFELDDYDMDLGLSFVDDKPESENSSATAQVVETISTKVEGIGNLEEKVDDIQSTLSGIKALLDFDELNIEGKLDTLLERVSDTEATDEEIERKVKETLAALKESESKPERNARRPRDTWDANDDLRAVCFNCGEAGHKAPQCDKAIVKPYRFIPGRRYREEPKEDAASDHEAARGQLRNRLQETWVLNMGTRRCRENEL